MTTFGKFEKRNGQLVQVIPITFSESMTHLETEISKLTHSIHEANQKLQLLQTARKELLKVK